MSQKKHKKLRKLETLTSVKETFLEPVSGVRQIIKENWKFLLLLCLGIFLLYFNSLRGDFVSDDYATIPQNPQINDFGYMVKNSAAFTNYIVYKLFGMTSTIAHHFFSLLVYLFFIWLAFVVIEMIFKDKWLSRLTMIIFAVLPIHVEAVSWISGRIYLLLSVYTMLGLLGFILYIRNNQPKYLLLTLGTFILAFTTDKPRPFSLFLLILTYLLYIGIKKVKIDWKKVIASIFALTIIFTIFAWPYINIRINTVNAGYNGSGGIFYNPFFQYPTAIAKYLQLMFMPIDLTLYHTMYILPTWLNWLTLIVYLTSVIYFYFKDKKIFFALVFIFAAAAPSMAPVKVSWLVAERYMFLGSLGFSLFLALIFERLKKKNIYIAIILLASLMSFYCIRTYLRNIDWQTNHKLWVNTCQVSPNSHNAWNNIGDDYDKLQKYDDAVKGFTQSTVVKPDYADAYHNRANIFYKTGRLDLARDSYETALKYSPSLYQTYFSLVQIDLTEKRNDLALQHAEAVVKLQPNNVQAFYVLAVVYAQSGKKEESKNILKSILNVYPQFKVAQDLYDSLGK